MADTKGLEYLMAFTLQQFHKAGYSPEELAQLFCAENVRGFYALLDKKGGS